MTRRPHARRPRPARRGMTLIEVMIALVILTGALLSLGRYTSQFAKVSSTSAMRLTALQLAGTRIDSIRGVSTYTALDGVAATESNIAGFRGYTRTTAVRRVGGGGADLVDYKVVTVTVTHPVLTTPVKKTTMIPVF